MVDFDLFGKSIEELTEEDIQELPETGVTEGLYIEAKRSFPSSNRIIAKVVSSFANTYGGYLLIGVDASDESGEIDAVVGADISDMNQPLDRIRNVVQAHVDPTPDFETQLILRSEYEGYGLILVEVPKSENTPHVNSDGKIYRRNGEGSDPIEPETDRWHIDQLYDRREQFEEQKSKYREFDVNVPFPTENWPYIEVYAFPSTFDESVCIDVITDLNRFEESLQGSFIRYGDPSSDGEDSPVELPTSFDYDVIRTSSSGALAYAYEYSEGSDNSSMTIGQYRIDGGMKFRSPIPGTTHSHYAEEGMPEDFELQTDLAEQFGLRDILSEEELGDVVYVNGENLFSVLVTLMGTYMSFLTEFDWDNQQNRELEIFIDFYNSDNTVLTFDNDEYRKVIGEHGPPVNYERSISAPVVQDLTLTPEIIRGNHLQIIIPVFIEVGVALGIPLDQVRSMMGWITDYMIEVLSGSEEY